MSVNSRCSISESKTSCICSSDCDRSNQNHAMCIKEQEDRKSRLLNKIIAEEKQYNSLISRKGLQSIIQNQRRGQLLPNNSTAAQKYVIMHTQIKRKKSKANVEIDSSLKDYQFPIDEARTSIESHKFIQFNKKNPIIFFHDKSDDCFPNFEILEDLVIKEETVPLDGSFSKSKSH